MNLTPEKKRIHLSWTRREITKKKLKELLGVKSETHALVLNAYAAREMMGKEIRTNSDV